MKNHLEQSITPSFAEFPKAAEIDFAFIEALKNNSFSGASLLIGNAERVIFHNCWGSTHSSGVTVDKETRFDLASLTKPLVTALLCAGAVSRRMLSLDDSLQAFFPIGSVPSDKKSISIRQLLSHCSGLPPYLPFYQKLIRWPFAARQSELQQWIMQTSLIASPGKTTLYSDLGFLLLGSILQTVMDDSLDQLAHSMIFDPLLIDELDYHLFESSSNPSHRPEFLDRKHFDFAATEFCPWRQRLLQGEVHDENAYCLGGVAAHAGLFGTATGIYYLLSELLRLFRNKLDKPPFTANLLQTFWTRQKSETQGTWALGFDTPSVTDSSSGRFFSSNTVGHLGFTGTSFWMDLEQEVIVILLTNRVYPTRNNEKIKEFRPSVHNLAMKAFYEFSK